MAVSIDFDQLIERWPMIFTFLLILQNDFDINAQQNL